MEKNEYTLHDLDLELNDYLRGTIGGADPHLLKRLLAGNPLLRDYVLSGRRSALLLFNDDEMHDLREAVSRMRQCVWIPWPHAHHLYVRALPWIRREVSKATAEHFAKDSVGFIETLEQEGLSLEEGFDVVYQWLVTLRQIKRALKLQPLLPRPPITFPKPRSPLMHPPPQPSDGGFPTPTTPDLSVVSISPTESLLLNASHAKPKVLTVTEAATRLREDVDISRAAAKTRISRAATAKEFNCEGKGAKRRIEEDSFSTWLRKEKAKYEERRQRLE